MSMVAPSPVTTTTMLVIYLLLIGECFTCRAIHKSDLESCFRNGGKCREYYVCPKNRQSLVKTICIHKHKVCCMKNAQQ
ncbi:uncharacterized protein Dvir_GJ26794 [Drosophila virilis]|uniref:Uncharacterized protein n=1 Tax=Drosophila virilis TaxID=7244 RepID=A0A0Q9WC68_DROVI|nr:uncharacterized protein Dvir_GJ26794 [Drosophila virilis]